MTLEQLQEWILSSEGLRPELNRLACRSAIASLGLNDSSLALFQANPDWRRLMLAGSVLAASNTSGTNEAALMIAQAGLLLSENPLVADAGAALLSQLANHRAIRLAIDRERLREGIEERLGVSEQMLLTRRELALSVFLHKGEQITGSRFQRQFWDELERATWISASAPTASGKTYLVLQWMLDQFSLRTANLAVFVAPTRALVGEIERQLLELAPPKEIDGLRIASLPLAALGDGSKPTILVFTQERLHAFLNSLDGAPHFDIVIVDEVHKLGDGLRGIVLQDAIERLVRANSQSRMVFLSPLTKNPETVMEGAPADLRTAVVPSEVPTVTQNLLMAEQKPRHSDQWQLSLRRNGELHVLTDVKLHARPDTQLKRLSYVALALGRNQTGTLVYANGAADAETLAWHIFEGLEDEFANEAKPDEELADLSELARKTVHPQFQLVKLVTRGVAFHYGNMPTLLRSEIERLFTEGKIRFLVCTSTLVEGVNLACRTIVARGPKRGQSTPMGPHDFWNLAGRAGRWGQDFTGNIVCVDVKRTNLWPSGVPERTSYPIERQTDVILANRESMIAYLQDRSELATGAIDPPLEYVTAYLAAWRTRVGSLLSAPPARSLPQSYARQIDLELSDLLENVTVPSEIIGRHTGVSAISMQSLLTYFETREKPVEELVPAHPESDDAHQRLVAIFYRISNHLYPAFTRPLIPVHALVTLEWMRGQPLGQIIRQRIKYVKDRNREINLPKLIRDTMRDVEEVARFRAPKYLAAYLDILRHFLEVTGQVDLFPEGLAFDVYLEFGVSTTTLLSLIGLGLSRTSAIALNEFLTDTDMDERQVLEWLSLRRWESQDMPAVVKREISLILDRRLRLSG